MTLTVAAKQALINDYQVHGTDTGSAPVQVAMLSERINQLSRHLQRNRQDYASRQGLLKMLGRRKRLLGYIRQRDDGAYRELIQRLKLRG